MSETPVRYRKTPKAPFIAGNILLAGLAAALVFFGPNPWSIATVLLVVLCLAIGGVLTLLPFLLDQFALLNLNRSRSTQASVNLKAAIAKADEIVEELRERKIEDNPLRVVSERLPDLVEEKLGEAMEKSLSMRDDRPSEILKRLEDLNPLNNDIERLHDDLRILSAHAVTQEYVDTGLSNLSGEIQRLETKLDELRRFQIYGAQESSPSQTTPEPEEVEEAVAEEEPDPSAESVEIEDDPAATEEIIVENEHSDEPELESEVPEEEVSLQEEFPTQEEPVDEVMAEPASPQEDPPGEPSEPDSIAEDEIQGPEDEHSDEPESEGEEPAEEVSQQEEFPTQEEPIDEVMAEPASPQEDPPGEPSEPDAVAEDEIPEPEEPSLEETEEAPVEVPATITETEEPPKEEPKATGKPAKIIASAFVGIQNGIYLRGEGPGLSLEKGVRLEMTGIGEWVWTNETQESISAELLLNDEIPSDIGVFQINPGDVLKLNPSFPPRD
ncbi:hypothetical protein [Puniceicoccus vermicola]|uniref:Uncharacterized protein n=1 Tax=Puniceicoccus vermicola TaxID=388746 RepID=A0A7X1E326_9BACT|nr:hypothetical protein [Puniceicoccus vermicola]MBC2601055.1 hypothetical protein [Puniceicoccus vermicola]